MTRARRLLETFQESKHSPLHIRRERFACSGKYRHCRRPLAGEGRAGRGSGVSGRTCSSARRHLRARAAPPYRKSQSLESHVWNHGQGRLGGRLVPRGGRRQWRGSAAVAGAGGSGGGWRYRGTLTLDSAGKPRSSGWRSSFPWGGPPGWLRQAKSVFFRRRELVAIS